MVDLHHPATDPQVQARTQLTEDVLSLMASLYRDHKVNADTVCIGYMANSYRGRPLFGVGAFAESIGGVPITTNRNSPFSITVSGGGHTKTLTW